MKPHFFSALLFGVSCSINAQDYNQSFTLTSSNDLTVYEIDADISGNVTIIGGFYDSLDIDPGAGVHMIYTSQQGYEGSYIASYTSSGQFRWGLSSDSLILHNPFDKPQAIKVYPDGTTYYLSRIKGTVDLDPSSGTQFASGIGEVFVTKMNANGTFGNYYRLTEDSVETANMAMDINKNIYIIGSFAGASFDADGAIGTKTFINNGYPYYDNFLVKYDATGNIFLNVGFNFGTTKNEYGGYICVDDLGHIFIYGGYNPDNTLSMNMNPDTANPVYLTSYQSLFLAQYMTSDGALLWAHSLGTNYSAVINDVTTDNDGFFYFTGKFKGSVSFDLINPSNGILQSNNNKYTIFISKCDSLANFQFAKKIGTGSFVDIEAKGIHLGSDNQIMILGTLTTNINFDPLNNPSYLYSSTSNGDIFLTKYNKTNGNIAYVDIFPCLNTSEFRASYMIDTTFYIAGSFKGNLDLNPDTLLVSSITSSSSAIYDFFISQYGTFFRDTTSSNSIIENDFETSLSIFPNPFLSQTTLQTDNHFNNATLTLDNYLGQTVKQIKNISGQAITLHRDNLPSGLYFVRLAESNEIIMTDKLVITE